MQNRVPGNACQLLSSFNDRSLSVWKYWLSESVSKRIHLLADNKRKIRLIEKTTHASYDYEKKSVTKYK